MMQVSLDEYLCSVDTSDVFPLPPPCLSVVVLWLVGVQSQLVFLFIL